MIAESSSPRTAAITCAATTTRQCQYAYLEAPHSSSADGRWRQGHGEVQRPNRAGYVRPMRGPGRFLRSHVRPSPVARNGAHRDGGSASHIEARVVLYPPRAASPRGQFSARISRSTSEIRPRAGGAASANRRSGHYKQELPTSICMRFASTRTRLCWWWNSVWWLNRRSAQALGSCACSKKFLMQPVNIGIIGLGNVGSGALDILAETADQIALKLGFPLRVARSVQPPCGSVNVPAALGSVYQDDELARNGGSSRYSDRRRVGGRHRRGARNHGRRRRRRQIGGHRE